MLQWSASQLIVLPITLLIILLITLTCYLFLNKTNHKNAPLKIIAITVVILEIIKQVKNISIGFDPYDLPFHYCSLFVFLFPLAQFGNEKTKKIINPVTFACALTVTIGIYLTPSSIISSSCDNIFANFYLFHTFTFHHLVILYTIISITLYTYVPKKNDYLLAGGAIAIYGIIGITFSYLLNSNYCNFLRSCLSFLEEWRLKVGQVPYVLVIYFAIIGGTIFSSFMYYLISIKLLKRKTDA